MAHEILGIAGHRNTQGPELKRSRAQFEEPSWMPELKFEGLDDTIPAKKRAILSNASKLFLEMQAQVRNKMAEMREKDEKERAESRRIAEMHPIAWPDSPKEAEEPATSHSLAQEDAHDETRNRSLPVTTPGTPETVVLGAEKCVSEITPSLSPIKEVGAFAKQTNGKQLVFSSGIKHDDEEAMPCLRI